MISFLDPRLWVFFLACGLGGFMLGVSQESRQAQKINLKAAEHYAKLEVTSRAETLELQKTIDTLRAEKQTEKEYAKVKMDRIRRDVTAGTLRLSVPVAACPNPITSAGTRAQFETPRAELLPETSLDLINLAADADDEVRRTNECIAAYNAVKAQSLKQKID